ncbi:hypothetical protein Cantr_07713 [Candida viswanathii]|uniref:Secreted glycosidase n=1 Tax=Candida viswanathii TaxID=5486 RepID=A0A367Y172_9ASCO|nr:hypothetical protein Cantr_07713 [Candida viswanathii]
MSLISAAPPLSPRAVPAPPRQRRDNKDHGNDDGILDQVDLFYGTESGGHMFPGISLPFGMVKPGVDVLDASFGDSYSGYAPGGRIVGVSMMHESGTGGAPEYGVVAQLPFTDESLDDVLGLDREFGLERSAGDEARIGVYSVKTEHVDFMFTCDERSSMIRYRYDVGEIQNARVLVNVSHHLGSPGRPWWTQYFVNGSITVDDEEPENKYTGYTTIKGGWGGQDPWTIYFCGEFNHKFTKKYGFINGNHHEEDDKITSDQNSMGMIFEFDKDDLDNGELISRVGVSFVSTAQACSNIHDDNDDNYDFDTMVQSNRQKWTNEVFNKIEIEDSNQTLTSQFFTNLYGVHLMPTNRTGETPPSWTNQNDPVYYDDFFTIWDTFRSLNPLLNIINPTRGSEIIQGIVNIYLNDGWTPDGRSANQNGRVQGGTNSDILIADAYVKQIPGVDWDAAYRSMVNNAENQPPYWYDSFAPDASTKQGRGALPDWLEYGYITRNYSRSVSRTVEYAYNDFALSVLAKDLAPDDHEKYLRRSTGWQNLWNHDAKANGYSYTGFLQPRNADGEFNSDNYDPLSCKGCYWKDDEYEGKPIEYGWSVPFDMQTLKSFMDDDDEFIQRLNDMYGLHGTEIVDVGNEPSFLTPFLYNFVNEQYRTVELVRYIVYTYFKTGKSGLPGNSDAGAMQSWLVFSLLGFYPISGTTTYLISSPFVSKATINLENGARVTITANNLSQENIYVQSLKINGEDWDKNWFEHNALFGENGGSIEFELGGEQTVWETGEVPPSPGHISD